jgi:predicted metal-dependent hydrolase
MWRSSRPRPSSSSTRRLGITVTPRRPDFDFEGLEHEVPRAWHPAGIGPTAFLEALSAMAPVAESFFIADARRLLPRIADGALRAEGDVFLRREAAHAGMHAAFNRLLVRWGVPVDPIADSLLRWLAIVDWTSSDLRSAVAMAGEHFLGEIGNAILSRPELLAARDFHAWRGLIRFVVGRDGMLRGRWRAVVAYHRRDFHPWRYLDNRRVLSEVRDTIVDPAWELTSSHSDARRFER